VGVAEAHLVAGAGVGPLPAADRPGALRPAGTGKIQRGQLGDPGTPAGSAVGIHGGLPCRVGQGQDRLLDTLVAVEPDREPRLRRTSSSTKAWVAPAESARTRMGRPRAGLGRASRAIANPSMWSWAVLDPALPDRRIMASAIPGAIAAVQPATKRLEPVALLVGRRRALLVGVRLDQGRVQVQDQWPAGAAPSAQARSRTLASADHSPLIPRGSAGSASARMRQAVGVETTWPNSSGWSPQAGQAADAVTTVGERDHQVAQHLTAVMGASTHAEVGPAASSPVSPSRSDSSLSTPAVDRDLHGPLACRW
jgi:hypothetical protein